jgi:hypothetical protein
MPFLFFVWTPFYSAFAHQKGSNFNVFVTLDFEMHIFLAYLQFRYFGQLDGVLSHGGKYSAGALSSTPREPSTPAPSTVHGPLERLDPLRQFAQDCFRRSPQAESAGAGYRCVWQVQLAHFGILIWPTLGVDVSGQVF